MSGRPTQLSRSCTANTPLLLSLQALADPVRLHILALLRQREQCVCHLTEELKLTQGTVSHHMGVLKRSGLVQVRRDDGDARWVYYRLDPEASSLLRLALGELLDTSGIDPNPAVCCAE